MKISPKDLYSYFELNGKFYIQVPNWLFAKGDNHKLEAKLFEKDLVNYFIHVRDTFEAELVNYKSFIGFYIKDESKIKALVKILNQKMKIKLNQKGE